MFCLVAELGSISRAAEHTRVAQPVISAHIKGLADKLGVQLLSRAGRRITLSEDGKRVYVWARDVVSRTMELERELADTRRTADGSAVVSTSMTLGSYVLPSIISAFRRDAPDGHISVRVTTPVAATDAIRKGDCDFGFTILDPNQDTDGLAVQKTGVEELILVAPQGSEFASTRLGLDELAALPFVTAQARTSRRDIEETALATFGLTRRRIVLEFGHGEAIKQAVRSGAGVAFLFRSSVLQELACGDLMEIQTAGIRLEVPVYQVTRRGKSLSSFQTALLSHVAAELGRRLPRGAG